MPYGTRRVLLHLSICNCWACNLQGDELHSKCGFSDQCEFATAPWGAPSGVPYVRGLEAVGGVIGRAARTRPWWPRRWSPVERAGGTGGAAPQRAAYILDLRSAVSQPGRADFKQWTAWLN